MAEWPQPATEQLGTHSGGSATPPPKTPPKSDYSWCGGAITLCDTLVLGCHRAPGAIVGVG
jgi:hypothetical protein